MPSTDLQTALSSDLRISVMRLARRLRTERADHGLTLGQISMLATLDRHGAMTAGELALHEGIRPPSVTRTLAALEELGFITRCGSDTDRRQTVVTLTDTAVSLLGEDRRRRDALLEHLLSDLSADERALLTEAVPLLERLAGG